jgi:hypothetical protein
MTDGGKRYFTRAEVERLIPRLTALMGPVMEAHAEATGLRTELQEGQRRVMLTGGARLDLEFWRSRKAGFDRATNVVQRGLGAILELGGAPKDLDLGLVDFLGQVGGREVNLCWRHGEDAIRFWHGLDEGYGARKPLPDAGDSRRDG